MLIEILKYFIRLLPSWSYRPLNCNYVSFCPTREIIELTNTHTHKTTIWKEREKKNLISILFVGLSIKMNENCFEGKMSRKKKSTPDKDSILRNETLRACVCVCVCVKVCVWVCGCVTGWNPANAFHFIGSEHRCRRRRRKDGWKRVEEERKREFDYCWKPIIIFFWQVKQNQMLFKGKIKKKKKFNNILFVTDGFWLLRPH